MFQLRTTMLEPCNRCVLLRYCLGIDPLDAVKEKDGIAALQALESKVDHSVCYVSLLRR